MSARKMNKAVLTTLGAVLQMSLAMLLGLALVAGCASLPPQSHPGTVEVFSGAWRSRWFKTTDPWPRLMYNGDVLLFIDADPRYCAPAADGDCRWADIEIWSIYLENRSPNYPGGMVAEFRDGELTEYANRGRVSVFRLHGPDWLVETISGERSGGGSSEFWYRRVDRGPEEARIEHWEERRRERYRRTDGTGLKWYNFPGLGGGPGLGLGGAP